MLARRLSVLFALIGAAACALGGCVIEVNDSSGPGGVGGGGGEDATTTTSGEGGATTTTTTATGTGGSGGTGVGGSGGGEACVGVDGKGTVADCDAMNITPESHGGGASPICGDNLDEEPPGYGVCVRGFEIFTAGSATNLQQCLATIGVQNACDVDPVGDCYTKMVEEACLTQDTVDICDSFKKACADQLDDALCRQDFAPLSDQGLQEFEDCFNAADPNLSCQDAYEECITTVLSF